MESSKYYSNQRRVRTNSHIRELAAAFHLNHKEFIQPLFVEEEITTRMEIPNLTGIYAETIDSLKTQIADDVAQGITKFLLFPVPKHKSENDFDYSFVIKAIQEVKKEFGNRIWLALDVCLCAYTSHGHCGILNKEGTKVLNHESVAQLAAYSLKLARAGADCIAPSDMMDGRIKAIRTILDSDGFDDIAIMSYSAKFSSNFYGPFRDACKSSPGLKNDLQDRKTYQISVFNPDNAIISCFRDISEGADIVMVKPAVPYLDIIKEIRQHTTHPMAAYHVSGEYEGIELMARQGIISRSKAHVEVWTSVKRAGANMIISYAARHARKWISEISY